ncbi:MAG: hypothetical protein M3Y13_04700 [Armatimonadota bacterium]|nr:hypothetical protein [Armatimonadota bacterium]
MSTKELQQIEKNFRVGSQISFQFGRHRLKGVIIEERGAIGVGGRRLYRIEAPFDGEEPLVLELPAVDLQPA